MQNFLEYLIEICYLKAVFTLPYKEVRKLKEGGLFLYFLMGLKNGVHTSLHKDEHNLREKIL